MPGFFQRPGFSLIGQRGILIFTAYHVSMQFRIILFILLLCQIPRLSAQYFGVEEPIVGKWAIGIQLGVTNLNSDIPADAPGLDGSLYAQYSVSRVLDVKLQLGGGQASGMATTPVSWPGFIYNSALNGGANPDFAYDSTQQVFHNYYMQYLQFGGILKLNINRLIAPQKGETWDVYLLAGVGGFLYDTKVNAYDENAGSLYDYSGISTSGTPQEIRAQLGELLDQTYETQAQRDFLNQRSFGNYMLTTSFLTGAGFRIRASDHFAIGLEAQYTFISDDLVDGQQWTDDAENPQSLNNDKMAALRLTLDYIF